MIVFDNREPPRLTELVTLAAHGDTKAVLLETADYVICDQDGCTMGIERKTITDFLGSVSSGRLMKQLGRLRKQYDPAILLLEGGYKILPNMRIHAGGHDTGWHHSVLHAMMLSLQRDGVMVMYTMEHRGTADVLRLLNERAAKGCIKYGSQGGLLATWPSADQDALINATLPKPKARRIPTRTRRPMGSPPDCSIA